MAIGSCDLANILDKIVLSEHWKWLFSWSIKISKFSRRKTPDPQAAHPIGVHVIRRWSKISRFYILKRYLWRIERYIWGKLTSRVLTVKAVLKLKNSFRRIWRTYGRQVSHKSVQKSLAEGVVQLEVLGVHMRRINYDSADSGAPNEDIVQNHWT